MPQSATIAELTAEEILTAAKRLGFRAEVEAEKNYPRQYFDYAGRVKVTKKAGTTKAQFLKQLAAELAKVKAAAAHK